MSYDTTSEDYYGGQNDANIVVFEGKKLYPVIDEGTGVTTWYERKGNGDHCRVHKKGRKG